MDTIELRFDNPLSPAECQAALSSELRVESTGDGGLCAFLESSRAYFRWPSASQEVASRSASSSQIEVDYTGTACARAALRLLLRGKEGTIDLDFGYAMSFTEFLAMCEREPDFDWRARID